MAGSSSSSSSSVTIDGFTYDVFLSFRGLDTRHIFTGNLYKALKDRGIRTFFDKENIPPGKEITPSLVKAIEQSRMAIVVLSPNYATSAFCLDELSHILDCITGRGRLVWPIFYDVDPSDVRWLKGTYEEVMATHEASSRYNADTLQKWKKALRQVANLSGNPYTWNNGGGYQYEFIAKIVEQVSRQIKPFTLPVADKLVGLDLRKQDVISLLKVGSNDEVLVVGIHGMGGIGKTTLALSVYNSIACQFEGSCFLQNVRENSEKHELTYLQNILLSEIVGEKETKLTSVKQGIAVIRQRLRQKKVLLLVDDVNEKEQLQAIAGEPKWFGHGSRVIITTRDEGLLTWYRVKSKYEMGELHKKDALDLLTWKIFRTDKVSPSSTHTLNLLKRVVTYASGLPLALEVLGSHLSGMEIKEWQDALDEYERIPHIEIQQILKVSFDALGAEEKIIFLDIACCFKGHKLKNVERILHAHHDRSMKHYIRVLVKKSLIKISESGNVSLHDLIEDMVKEIVRQESPEDPGKRSRLWSPEDIVHVLEDNTGTSEIEVICPNSSIKVNWDGAAFKKMEKLRTLIISSGSFSTNPKHLPNSLRLLEWKQYPSSGLPLDFYPKKLAICKLPDSKFTSIMPGDLFKKEFKNMRVLNFNSGVLTNIPDVSGLPNLEELSFHHCSNLITVDASVGLLDKLKILTASYCKNLRSIPPLNLPSLEELDLSHCVSLESFQDGSMEKLKILNVKCCWKLVSIPPLKLPSLEELKLSYCGSLESFPPVVDGSMEKLKILTATFCKKLRSIPPLKLPLLEELELSCCESLESFPPVVDGSMEKLKILIASSCKNLRSIPPLNLPSLEELDLSYCKSLESFPPVVDGSMEKLKILRVKGCEKLRSIPPLKLPLLEKLDLLWCDSLESFPEILGVIGNITELHLVYTGIKKLPNSFRNLTRLQRLYVERARIQLPRSIVTMSELTTLCIRYGGWQFRKEEEDEEKASPMQFSQMKFLYLLKCNLSDESLALGLKWFANVKELDLSGSIFTTLPECIKKCHFLWKLELDYCTELQEIKGIPQSLKTLSAFDCRSLTLSCKSELLNRELHEDGDTGFLLPEAEIPEWFEHQCREGSSTFFWFRNKLPAITLCVVSQKIWSKLKYGPSKPEVILRINNNENGDITEKTYDPMELCHLDIYDKQVRKCYDNLGVEITDNNWDTVEVDFYDPMELCHLHIFHMQMEKLDVNLDRAFSENKWNQVEVVYEYHGILATGIHVLKEKSSMEDIRFTNPENDDVI